MRLKVLTTTLLVFSVCLMLAWPLMTGQRPPHDAPQRAKAEWGRQVLVYFGAAAGSWIATAASALFLARQTRRQFVREERENLKGLIEGTLKDHARKP